MYAEAMRNPKVARLSDKDFRTWVQLLAVASENGGKLPGADDLRFMVSMRLDHLLSALDRLISGGLIDSLVDGYEPHNWTKFQYKSDSSTERVSKHRRSRNVSVTPPETEAEAEVPLSNDNGPAAEPIDEDAAFWADSKSFLTRRGVRNPGALIGKWCRDHTKSVTARALTDAQLDRPADVVAFVEGCFRRQGVPEPVVPL